MIRFLARFVGPEDTVYRSSGTEKYTVQFYQNRRYSVQVYGRRNMLYRFTRTERATVYRSAGSEEASKTRQNLKRQPAQSLNAGVY